MVYNCVYYYDTCYIQHTLLVPLPLHMRVTYGCIAIVYVCMYVCMCVCMCMYVYVCMYVCVCMYMYVCMYVYLISAATVTYACNVRMHNSSKALDTVLHLGRFRCVWIMRGN
jgi:hypothetical protein